MIDNLVNFIKPTQSTVYDTESLTTLESIGKCIDKINECIKNFNNLENNTNDKVQNLFDELNNQVQYLNSKYDKYYNKVNDFEIEFRTLLNDIENVYTLITKIENINNEIKEQYNKNMELLNSSSVATTQDIQNLNKLISINESKHTKILKPTLCKPCDIAGINSKLDMDWIKDKETLNTYLDNIKEFNIKDIYLILNNGVNKNGELFISYNKNEFNSWRECYQYFINLLKEKGMRLYAVKLHTSQGNGCAKLSEILQRCTFDEFKTMYRNMLTDIVNFFKIYTDRIILFNEMEWLYLDKQYSLFIRECLSIINTSNLKSSISTLNPYNYVNIPDDVKNEMSFYCCNYYPPLSYNGMNVSISSMVDRMFNDTDYSDGIKYMVTSGKEVVISETGCNDKYDSLAQPWKWQNFIDNDEHNGEVQKIFIEVILTLLNNDKISSVCYWFDLKPELKPYINKLTGGVQ